MTARAGRAYLNRDMLCVCEDGVLADGGQFKDAKRVSSLLSHVPCGLINAADGEK
jgi:hypothetical protein